MRVFPIGVLSAFASGSHPPTRWSTRALAKFGFTAAVLATVIFGAQCVLDFDNVGPSDTCEVQPNELFAGCFEGPVTDPVDGGKVKVVLLANDDLGEKSLTGCVLYSLADIREEILLTGETACMPSQKAAMTGTRPNGGTLEFTLLRQPEQGEATTLDVTVEGGLPFVNANGLARCAEPATACQ